MEGTDAAEQVQLGSNSNDTRKPIASAFTKPTCNQTKVSFSLLQRQLHFKFQSPSPPSTNEKLWVKFVQITEDNITVGYSLQDMNRMFQKLSHSDFLIVSFDKRLDKMYVKDILMNGITVDEKTLNCSLKKHFTFFSYSSNQIKQRTCFMYCMGNNNATVESIINQFGRFDKISNVSKRTARIGLLFSTCYPSITIAQAEKIADIENNGMNFSDGCGLISKDYANSIAKERSLVFRGKLHVPSVFQFRWRGTKGVVSLDPKLPSKTLQIRPSMEKFITEGNLLDNFCVCDYSRPYRFGHLNKQYIMLLSGLGIADEVFVKKMKEFYSDLELMTQNHETAFEYLMKSDHIHLAETLIANDRPISHPDNKDILQILKEIQAKEVEKIPKLRIMIRQSRNVFGICDVTEKLQYGECFFRPVIDGTPKTLDHGFVVVAKNPCYHLGDIRVLKLRDIPNCDHLVDTIVFPIQGKRPHSAEIAGSDLDGDMYFVCWDESLIPSKTFPPYSYPASPSPPKDKITQEDIINNFVAYDPFAVGRIHRFYNLWADRNGIACDECVELSKLFARAIDAAKTGEIIKIPDHLNPSKCSIDTTQPAPEKYVWQTLSRMASDERAKFQQHKIQSEETEYFDRDMLMDILERRLHVAQRNMTTNNNSIDGVAISEFELFRFLVKWCQANDTKLQESEFVDMIDFSRFTVPQLFYVMDNGIPKSVVFNALNKSKIVPKENMEYFQLQLPEVGWKFYYRGTYDRCRFSMLTRILQEVKRKLLIFQFENKTIGIYINDKMQPGQENCVEYNVTAFFFGQNVNRKVVLVGDDSKYKLFFNSERIQIYKGSIGNSFLWIGNYGTFYNKVPSNGKKIKSPTSTNPNYEDDRVIVSIDLNRFDTKLLRSFDKINKSKFQAVEVFVQDQDWTEYLDVFPSGLEYAKNLDSESSSEETTPFSLWDYILKKRELKDTQQPIETMDAITADAILASVQDRLTSEDAKEALKQLCDHNMLHHAILLFKQVNEQRQEYGYIRLDMYMWLIHCAMRCRMWSTVKDMLQLVEDNASSLFSGSPQSLKQLMDIMEKLLEGKASVDSFPLQIESLKLASSLLMIANTNITLREFAVLLKKCALNLDLNEIRIGAANENDNNNKQTSAAVVLLTKLRDVLGPLVKAKQGPVMKEYFVKYSYLMSVEFHEQAIQISEQIREGSESTQTNLKITLKDLMDPIAILSSQEASFETYQIGDPVVLTASDGTKLVKLQGTVVRADTNLIVELDEMPNQENLKEMLWRLDKDTNDVTYQRIINAMEKLCELGPEATPLFSIIHSLQCEPELINKLASEIYIQQKPKIEDIPLNKSQVAAVVKAFQQRLTIIQGPPGTGKTHTLGHLVREWVVEKRKGNPKIQRILAVAETNIAVDNMMSKFRDLGLTPLRIGSKSKTNVNLWQFVLEFQHQEEAKLQKKGRLALRKFLASIIDKVDVICCTQAKCGDAILDKYYFSHVVIDEVSQSIEPAVWLALVKGAEQVALFGDHKQLGPTVMSQNAVQLKTSLFERLIQNHLAYEMLAFQYRMHPSISCFPSAEFYEKKLQDAVDATQRPAVEGIAWKNDMSVGFIHIKGEERTVQNSKANLQEIDCILELLENIFQSQHIGPNDIGIISPYSAQVKLLKQKLSQKREIYSKIEVETVDGFQGREKEMILFSAVRSGNSVGFLNDDRRLNVMLTRAKRGLVVVGCRQTLILSAFWRKWLSWIDQNGLEIDLPKGKQPKAKKADNSKQNDNRRFYKKPLNPKQK